MLICIHTHCTIQRSQFSLSHLYVLTLSFIAFCRPVDGNMFTIYCAVFYLIFFEYLHFILLNISASEFSAMLCFNSSACSLVFCCCSVLFLSALRLIHRAGMITISSYLSFHLSSRSLPGSALELRYSHGGGSLPTGSTTHLDPFGNASAGGVVRRSHRARWSSAREDSTKVTNLSAM